MSLLKHPYSGLYWTEEYVERYAALEGNTVSREEVVRDLVENHGFKPVRMEHPEPIPSDTPSVVIELCSKFTDPMERIATSLEIFAKQTRNLSPPIGVDEVAKLAKVTSKTVYRWKGEGRLKPLADNRPLLFSQEEVEEFLKRRRRGR